MLERDHFCEKINYEIMKIVRKNNSCRNPAVHSNVFLVGFVLPNKKVKFCTLIPYCVGRRLIGNLIIYIHVKRPSV